MKNLPACLILLLSSIGCNISNYMSEPEDSSFKTQTGSPDNPTFGKCYIRCFTPETYDIQEVGYPIYTGGDIDADLLDTLILELSPTVNNWVYKSETDDCRSSDPKDCLVLCHETRPAKSQEIIVVNDTTKTDLFETRHFEIRQIRDIGGATVWEEIECSLTDFNDLPIYFSPESSILDAEGKETINNFLLGLMKDKPNISVEISSHTDARGDAGRNRNLSQKRAEAVVQYLISRGIQRTRLTASGYGEDLLKNRCRDGVDCTEAEHLENERTEFRVLSY